MSRLSSLNPRLVLGLAIGLGALIIGVVPVLTACTGHLDLVDGRTVPMKCHWTALAEIALAIPLGLVAAGMVFARRAESLRVLSIVGVGLGSTAILLSTVLIGTCTSPDMHCNLYMRPAVILTGTVVVAASLAMFMLSRREVETVA